MTGSAPGRGGHGGFGGRGGHRGDEGSTTILVLAVACLGLVAASVLMGLSEAAVTRARAQGVADVAAIAGAASVFTAADEDGPCVVAARVASRHDASLLACRVQPGGFVEVRVVAATSLRGEATARARAGPGR